MAKGTKAAVDAAGNRISRPKYDAATAAFAQHYVVQNGSKQAGATTSDGPTNLIYCPECGGGSGGNPPGSGVVSTFVSSVNQGGSGVIYDLKLVADTGYTLPGNEIPQPGYTRLNADLNKGAGGNYIYFTFTRRATDIRYYGQIGLDYKYGPLTYFSAVTRPYLYQQAVPWPADHAPIWFINENLSGPVVYTEQLDLNNGCGWVDMVFAHQSKNPAFGSPVSEVGVLSGNSDSIQPPTGWVKVGVDLNKSAGGDYIYLCFKR